MYKTRGQAEKQEKGFAEITELEPGAIQAVLLERAKHGARNGGGIVRARRGSVVWRTV